MHLSNRIAIITVATLVISACNQAKETANPVSTTIPAAQATAPQSAPASGTDTGRTAEPFKAEDHYSQAYNDCMKATEGVTSEILSCSGQEIDRQDKTLNENYKAAMAKAADQTSKDKLRNDERAWIRERDKKCKAEGSVEEGGTDEALIYNDCILAATTERAHQLAQ